MIVIFTYNIQVSLYDILISSFANFFQRFCFDDTIANFPFLIINDEGQEMKYYTDISHDFGRFKDNQRNV